MSMSFNFTSFTEKSKKAIEFVRQDVATLRTGRATVQILDPVTVEAYGTTMKLEELATVSAPDSSSLLVSPWDKSLLESIEKAIAKAGLNLNPVVSGDVIRIAIAPLTEETRKEMVRQLERKIESGRVMLRNVRAGTKQEIESQEKSGGVSEDDIKRELLELDKLLQEFISELDSLEDSKQKELMSV